MYNFKPALSFRQHNLQHCCGVDELGGFFDKQAMSISTQAYPTFVNMSGTGLYIATFNQEQRHELRLLKENPELEVVYQTDWLHNNNSGNQVCLLVLRNKYWEETVPEEEEDEEEPF